MQLNIFNEFSEFWMTTSPLFSSGEFSKNIKKKVKKISLTLVCILLLPA